MAQDIGNLRIDEHEINGDEHRTEPRKREANRCKGVGVAGEDRNPIPRADANPAQTPGETIADTVKLRVAPIYAATLQRKLVGCPAADRRKTSPRVWRQIFHSHRKQRLRAKPVAGYHFCGSPQLRVPPASRHFARSRDSS